MTFRRLITSAFLALVCWTSTVTAARAELPLALSGQAAEGGLMFGKTNPGAIVALDGVPVKVSPRGNFLLGFGRDDAGLKILQLRLGAETMTREITVRDRDFKIERVDGLPKRKVTPDPKAIARIQAEKALMASAKVDSDPEAGYLDGFVWPVTGRLSGVYGSQRILNGKLRRPHYGTDVAAPEGTPIRAIAGGRIAFVHPGMFFNGKNRSNRSWARPAVGLYPHARNPCQSWAAGGSRGRDRGRRHDRACHWTAPAFCADPGRHTD